MLIFFFFFLPFRLLLALYPEEDQLVLYGLCKALPHFLPAEQLGLYISRKHFPLAASPGGTLLRLACCTYSTALLPVNFKTHPEISNKNLAPFSETADGLCCRLTGPCFIKGRDKAREAKPGPTTVRRPTINWKDISRCGRFFPF